MLRATLRAPSAGVVAGSSGWLPGAGAPRAVGADVQGGRPGCPRWASSHLPGPRTGPLAPAAALEEQRSGVELVVHIRPQARKAGLM